MVEWEDTEFILVDTGGMLGDTDDWSSDIHQQATVCYYYYNYYQYYYYHYYYLLFINCNLFRLLLAKQILFFL